MSHGAAVAGLAYRHDDDHRKACRLQRPAHLQHALIAGGARSGFLGVSRASPSLG